MNFTFGRVTKKQVKFANGLAALDAKHFNLIALQEVITDGVKQQVLNNLVPIAAISEERFRNFSDLGQSVQELEYIFGIKNRRTHHPP